MKLPRDVSLKINWFFDQLIPPILRDCRWFMYVPMRMAFRHKAHLFMNFKDGAHNLSIEQYEQLYAEADEVRFTRETDLNRRSVELILAHVKGPQLLEVGCGRGYLSRRLAALGHDVTATDITVEGLEGTPNLNFRKAAIEQLPFADKAFDTVVCTHTLEHILDLARAIRELRRVAERLVVVVPRQRPYRYTFDLHVNFFPYLHSLYYAMGKRSDEVICVDAGGDIFYVEDVQPHPEETPRES